MGVVSAVARAFALHDSDRRHVSLEFSLAAIFRSRLSAICAAEALRSKAGVTDPGYSGAWTCRLDRRRGVDLRHDWLDTLSRLTWILIGLAVVWLSFELLLRGSEFGSWALVVITFCAFLATYLCVPTNCGVPRYNFSQELLKPAPLDPQRLYLSVYPWAELSVSATANKPEPVGQTLRPGSTSMWAGLRFINGYSPIRAAGVAREFETSIHGEINPDVGSPFTE